jgi:hypothetical protein
MPHCNDNFFAAEPTAMQLITTFLDKAGCIEGGQVEFSKICFISATTM